MNQIKHLPLPEYLEHCSKVGSHSLVLYNDDVNLFEYVVDSLVEVCNHSPVQAEQCALIAHHKGKCDVRIGYFNELHAMMSELSRRGLSTEIYRV